MTPTGPDRQLIGSAAAAVRGEIDEDEADVCEVLALEDSDFTAEAFEPASTRSLSVFVNAPTTRTTVVYIMIKYKMCKSINLIGKRTKKIDNFINKRRK